MMYFKGVYIDREFKQTRIDTVSEKIRARK